MLTKENCSVFKMSYVSKKTGENKVGSAISHPDHSAPINLIGRNSEGENLSYDEMIAKLKVTPDWRNNIIVREHPEYGFYALLSNVSYEALDL